MLALAASVIALAAPLPDLDQAAPLGLAVVPRHGRLLLVFGSAVDNVGPGELVVVGRRVGKQMRTWQVVGDRRYPLRVRLRYVRSETHEHWHFPAFERYELRRPDGSARRPRPQDRLLPPRRVRDARAEPEAGLDERVRARPAGGAHRP